MPSNFDIDLIKGSDFNNKLDLLIQTNAAIARSLDKTGEETDTLPQISTWQTLQQVVKLGVAPKATQLGQSFFCNHADFGKIEWKVIGYDKDKLVNPDLKHSMAIITHLLLPSTYMYDAPEPTNPDANRQKYGCNRYSTSNIRQYLNSDGIVGQYFVPQSEYDVPASYMQTMDGFLRGLDKDFLSVIAKVEKTTALATVDGGGFETTEDLMWLPSMSEVYGGLNNSVSEGLPYEFFSENSDLASAGTGADKNRIKYRNGKADNWRLRSPLTGLSYYDWYLGTSGSLSSSRASTSTGVAVACCIA